MPEQCISSQLQTGSSHDAIKLATVEAEFEKELKDADARFSQLSDDEEGLDRRQPESDASLTAITEPSWAPLAPISSVLVRIRYATF